MPAAPPPRVSILIPNFNNGQGSSRDGQTDLIGDLLQSLQDTLGDDPTPVEILAYDDGSTDDSLDTLRDWAGRTWRGGQPLLSLTEDAHCGVLSRTANHLYAQARGDILVRLDGDTQMLTPRWASRLCDIFDAGPDRLGVVGPLQLTPAGRVHAFGDWVLHPKGYHHVAAGAHPDAITHAIEVDHVMGCFYCCKRAVYDAVGPFDEAMLRGQTIDFGLRARLAGFACIAVPHIRYVHRHGERVARATMADSQQGVAQTLDTFRAKWGFCRLAPDLDEVRRRYRNTPLLWNPAVFAPHAAEAPGNARTAPAGDAKPIDNTPWQRYTSDQSYRQWVDIRTSIIAQVIQQAGRPRRAAIVGGETGLIAHLVAGKGVG
ncbi:MAG: glycosyltransferase, partial [Phycisphaeraceae bacterium]